MAEQNKKSDIEKRVRAEAERIVDRFLKVAMSRENEAGWRGDNIIGRLIDFEGELPDPSGLSGFSQVWEQTVLLGCWPPRFRVSVRLMMELTENQRMAVCIDRAYRGRQRVATDTVNQRRERIYWSDKVCADALGCTKNALRSRINDGYKAMGKMLTGTLEGRKAA